MSEEKDKRHPFEMWFGLPVCVQLRGPYVVPSDAGPVEIPVGDPQDKKTKVFGSPMVTSDPRGKEAQGAAVQNEMLIAMSGDLQPDGDRLMLHARFAKGMGVRVSIDPRDIAFITVITDPAVESTIVAP